MRKMLLAAGVAALMLFAGCATQPKLTPAQVASIVCPAAKSQLQTMQLSGVFTGGAADTLVKQVQPDVDAVCEVGATVTDAKLQTLLNAAFPLVITAVKNSTVDEPSKQKAYLAISGLQTIISVNIALASATTARSPDPTSGAATQ